MPFGCTDTSNYTTTINTSNKVYGIKHYKQFDNIVSLNKWIDKYYKKYNYRVVSCPTCDNNINGFAIIIKYKRK